MVIFLHNKYNVLNPSLTCAISKNCLVLVLLRFNVPVNIFSVMSGQSHRFQGITSTFWEVNVSCSRTQHGDLSEDRTPDLSLRSPTLYHWATAPPYPKLCYKEWCYKEIKVKFCKLHS